MKKIFICAAVIVIVIILTFAVVFAVNSSQLTATEMLYNEEQDMYIVTHEMSRGDMLEISIDKNVTALSEDIYKVDILLNQSDNTDYSAENISLSYSVDENAEIISQYYGVGNDEYRMGVISYTDGMVINCHSDGDYIWCSFIIRSDSPEKLSDPDTVRLTYDIVGHFPHTVSKGSNVDPFV